eukprot:CAMPEP_0174358552 /NCGR_PEP_ID=MMETSP0811_2-20130205/43411_1 /TAXON_ID=73025 ORGANISM="Eutreptiella gymnastica-like, Strain CCMP1594" /NCGR_SAMPLE_ID=MMETSP0811_2 /ASSEMBLY_ACC=CAM_ASM_000667 /LENGTH=75 /DNA_ID=CAMNT_0015492437 /DNA_START=1304 /DNA_END=1528 /DNA_ORIENTATION=+
MAGRKGGREGVVDGDWHTGWEWHPWYVQQQGGGLLQIGTKSQHTHVCCGPGGRGILGRDRERTTEATGGGGGGLS